METIEEYQGLNGTTVSSLSWNWLMVEVNSMKLLSRKTSRPQQNNYSCPSSSFAVLLLLPLVLSLTHQPVVVVNVFVFTYPLFLPFFFSLSLSRSCSSCFYFCLSCSQSSCLFFSCFYFLCSCNSCSLVCCRFSFTFCSFFCFIFQLRGYPCNITHDIFL